jgi:Pyridoxamine 5'-phosphate oxidase
MSAEPAATGRPVAESNLDGYGAPMIAWSSIKGALEHGWSQRPGSGGPDRHTCWLATVRPNGLPHVMPLGARWIDGRLYFNAGAETQKAKNLAHDPHCVLTVATHAFDLVVEGTATTVTDEASIERIGGLYESGGWRTIIHDGALAVEGEFSAPSAGPPPWHVYELTPTTVFAVGTAEPYGAARFRLR